MSADEAAANVSAARSLLSDFEDVSLEEQHGILQHAVNELENAQRELPNDY